MGSKTLSSACNILFDESSFPFTLRVTGIKIKKLVQSWRRIIPRIKLHKMSKRFKRVFSKFVYFNVLIAY